MDETFKERIIKNLEIYKYTLECIRKKEPHSVSDEEEVIRTDIEKCTLFLDNLSDLENELRLLHQEQSESSKLLIEDVYKHYFSFDGINPCKSEKFIKSRTFLKSEIQLATEEDTQKMKDIYYTGVLIDRILKRISEREKADAENRVVAMDKISLKDVVLPLDAVNRNIWGKPFSAKNPLHITEKTGSKDGNDVHIDVKISINTLQDYKGNEVFRTLTAYDCDVLGAILSILLSGFSFMAITDIYKMMGGKSKTPAEELYKIVNSINEKLTISRITIDTTEEIRANLKYDYSRFNGIITDNLLHARYYKIIRKGKEIEGIQVLAMPVLLEFAESRRQLTKIPLELIQLPGRLTDNKRAIAHYLMISISGNRTRLNNAIKREHNIYKRTTSTDADRIKATNNVKKYQTFRLKIDTILKKSNINNPKHKDYDIKIIENILSYYIKCNFIRSYSFTGNGCIEIGLINEIFDEADTAEMMSKICNLSDVQT